jgi:prevent-host-death family protein
MTVIGALEAKAHFSELLDRAADGEEIVITKHGKPIVRLTSARSFDHARAQEAVEKLKALRKGSSLGGLSWKALKDDGRP